MPIDRKRARDLEQEDCIILPVHMMPAKAKIVNVRNVPTSKGKSFTIATLETLDGHWTGAKGEFGFYGEEYLEWERPIGKVMSALKSLNQILNPFTWFSN